MSTVLSINGTTVNRATAHIVLNRLSLSMDSPDVLEFTERVALLPGSYRLNQAVTLTVDGTIRFRGQIVSLHPSGVGQGKISVGYRCMGLSWLANNIFVTAPDGSGKMIFNLPETDQDYLPSNSGLNVGQILTRLYNAHAAQLSAIGITSWSATELAALTAVPVDPVHLSGRFWNAAVGLLSQWCNKYGAFITPDGAIHHPNMLSLTSSTLTLDSDPVILGNVSEDHSECYTQVVLRGGDDVEGAYLSLSDKTLQAKWTASQQSAWTYADFITPKGGYELGTINSMTSTTLSVTATEPIPISYSATTKWSNLSAEVYAYNPVAQGISFTEHRRITANTVPSGNNYTLTVDTPFDNSGYTKYSIRGQFAAQSLAWRAFSVVPDWVCTHLVKRFSKSHPWAPTDGVVVQTLTGMANVCFTQNGYKTELPMPFTIVPSDLSAVCTTRATATVTISGGAVTGFTGLSGGSGYAANSTLTCYIVGGGGEGATATATTNSSGVVTSLSLTAGGTGYTSTPFVLIGVQPGYIVFDQPICSAYCSQMLMNQGGSNIPAPTDVKVLLPYSRGVISVTAPLGGGYQGTAYSVNNVQRVLYKEYPQWLDARDTTSYQILAQEVLDTVKNTVIEGSIQYIGKYSTALTLGRALNIAGNGYATGYESIGAVIRSVTLDYAPDGGPSPWVTSLSFSTRLKPFSGDRLYAHASWGHQAQLAGGSNLFRLSTAQMVGLTQQSAENMEQLTTPHQEEAPQIGFEAPGQNTYRGKQTESERMRQEQRANRQATDAQHGGPTQADEMRQNQRVNRQDAEKERQRNSHYRKLVREEHLSGRDGQFYQPPVDDSE